MDNYNKLLQQIKETLNTEEGRKLIERIKAKMDEELEKQKQIREAHMKPKETIIEPIVSEDLFAQIQTKIANRSHS